MNNLNHFISESYFIIFLRVAYSVGIRLRGAIYALFRSFNLCGAKLKIGKMFTLKGGKFINLGSCVKIGNNCRFELIKSQKYAPYLKIGNNVNFGNNVHIGCIGKIIIENGVLMGSNILIIDHNHGTPKIDAREKPSEILPKCRKITHTGNIVIEKNVWICDGAIILGGSKIEEGAIIGAQEIVKGFRSRLITK